VLISLGFLVLIVLMSAAIAVIADNVGRKLGKKRMSWKCRAFSVRPKHVAQIGTALTGAAVSLGTILVITAGSKDVRNWIVRGQAAIAEAETAIEKTRELQSEIDKREKTILARDEQIQGKEDEIVRKTGEVQARTKEVEAAKSELVAQRKALGQLHSEVKRLRTEIPRLRQDVASARADVASTNQKLAERQGKLAQLQKKLTWVNQQLNLNKQTLQATNDQKNEITAKNTELLAKNAELDRQQQALNSDIERLTKDRDDLEAARQEAVNQLTETQRRLDELQTSLVRAKAELQTTEEKLQRATYYGIQYYNISNVSRVAPLTFRIQEEVARTSVDEGMSQANAEAAMNRLLRAARFAAIKRGARPNDEYPEASIVERRDPETKEVISGEELQRQIVRQIVGSRQPLVMVAYSSLNAFKGEPVSLDVVVYPNPLVYRHNQLVAESRIDGRRDMTEIYRQVVGFVGAQLREQAREDKMIPMAGTEETFIDVPTETVAKIVYDIKTAERPVRLLALATTDTRAGDPLKLTFQTR
jgi:uncharacterized protein (DUF3084 family)